MNDDHLRRLEFRVYSDEEIPPGTMLIFGDRGCSSADYGDLCRVLRHNGLPFKTIAVHTPGGGTACFNSNRFLVPHNNQGDD